MICVIQLKSSIKRSEKLKDRLKLIGLGHVNNAIFVTEEESKIIGRTLNNLVTYGPITKEVFVEVFANLLQKHKQKFLDNASEINLNISNLTELGELIFEDYSLLKKLNIKRTFNLHPARKGLISLKDKIKGELGFNSKIKSLIKRMLL